MYIYIHNQYTGTCLVTAYKTMIVNATQIFHPLQSQCLTPSPLESVDIGKKFHLFKNVKKLFKKSSKSGREVGRAILSKFGYCSELQLTTNLSLFFKI